MTKEPQDYSLVLTVVRSSLLPWYWAIAMITAVLLPFLVLAAYPDGLFFGLSQWSLWQNHLESPMVTIFIPPCVPFVGKLEVWCQVRHSLQFNF